MRTIEKVLLLGSYTTSQKDLVFNLMAILRLVGYSGLHTSVLAKESRLMRFSIIAFSQPKKEKLSLNNSINWLNSIML